MECYYNLKNYDDVKYLSAQALQKYPRNVYIINCVLGACKETDDEAGLERYLDYALAVFPNNDGLLHDKAFLMEKRLEEMHSQQFIDLDHPFPVFDISDINPRSVLGFYIRSSQNWNP